MGTMLPYLPLLIFGVVFALRSLRWIRWTGSFDPVLKQQWSELPRPRRREIAKQVQGGTTLDDPGDAALAAYSARMQISVIEMSERRWELFFWGAVALLGAASHTVPLAILGSILFVVQLLTSRQAHRKLELLRHAELLNKEVAGGSAEPL